jgi:hypothetical protein
MAAAWRARCPPSALVHGGLSAASHLRRRALGARAGAAHKLRRVGTRLFRPGHGRVPWHELRSVLTVLSARRRRLRRGLPSLLVLIPGGLHTHDPAVRVGGRHRQVGRVAGTGAGEASRQSRRKAQRESHSPPAEKYAGHRSLAIVGPKLDAGARLESIHSAAEKSARAAGRVVLPALFYCTCRVDRVRSEIEDPRNCLCNAVS